MNPTILSVTESKRLDVLERTIKAGQKSFTEVGMALAEIKSSKLYRSEFKTFDEYCQKRWGWKRSYTYQLIDSASAVKSLPESVSAIADKITCETQARELAKVPEEQRAQVIDIASSKAEAEDRPMTARDVREAREEIVDPEPEKPRVKVDWTHYTRKSLEEIYRGILKNDPENLAAHASIFSQYTEKLNHL